MPDRPTLGRGDRVQSVVSGNLGVTDTAERWGYVMVRWDGDRRTYANKAEALTLLARAKP